MKKLITLLLLIGTASSAQKTTDAKRLAYCETLEQLADEQNKPGLRGEAYYIRGKIASEQFDINSSNEWFFKALEILKKFPPCENLSKVYGYLATNASITGNQKDFDFCLPKTAYVYTEINSSKSLRDIQGKKIRLYMGEFLGKTDYPTAIELWTKLQPETAPKNYDDSMHVAATNFQLGWLHLQLKNKVCFDHLDVTEKIWGNLNSLQLALCLLTQVDDPLEFKIDVELDGKIAKLKKLQQESDLDKETMTHFYKTMANYQYFRKDEIQALENSLAAGGL